jgi:two-component system, NarL family, response regulator
MSATAPVRVLVADDQKVVRDGLSLLLGLLPGVEVIGTAVDGTDAVRQAAACVPDVVLMDLSMPVMGGVQATEAITSEFPHARIIALTTYQGDADIHRALQAGARGYLLKDSLRNQVADAIRTVHRGNRVVPPTVALKLAEFTPRVELTDRELDVLALMAKGQSNREIAESIGRTEATVKVHVLHILSKLGVDDRTAAVTVALKRGMIHLT